MKRTSTWAGTLLLLMLGSAGFAQQAPEQTNPPLPANVLGPQLVVWSELQKPKPVPQPLPPPTPDPPAQQPQQPPAAGSQTQEAPSAQLFTGRIIKDGSKYVLKVSETVVYQIDDQAKARLYEGKQVKIVGSLDAQANLIHLATIELLS